MPYIAKRDFDFEGVHYSKGSEVPEKHVNSPMKRAFIVTWVEPVESEEVSECGEGGCSIDIPIVEDAPKKTGNKAGTKASKKSKKDVTQLLVEDPSDAIVDVTIEDAE